MCDAVSLSIASTIAGVAGTAANSIGQMNAAKKQREAVATWQAEQKQYRALEEQRQSQMRADAEAARVKGLEQLTPEAQTEAVTAEGERLGDYLNDGETADAPQAVADQAMLSGQQFGTGSFQEELARKISETLGESRERIDALAQAQAYGGSADGLSRRSADIQNEAAQGIDMQNWLRKSSMGAYGAEQAVRPLEVTYNPQPLADLFASLTSVGGYTAGQGGLGAGGVSLPVTTTAIPTAKPTVALPNTMTAPTFRIL
jgi:hypothetical protein